MNKSSEMLLMNSADVWFKNEYSFVRGELKMFCFPYAGGSAAVYKDWSKVLPSNVQVIPVELPGRGARLREPPIVRLTALIDVLAEVIPPLLDTPFVFFGHSMGAVIAFELAHCLRRKCVREPEAVFVAGRQAPQIPDSDPVSYNLPKEEFIEELNRLNGTPNEVLENAELMEMMIPLLRADFQLIQTYNYVADTPLRCPIIVYGGLQDHDVSREILLPWKDLTSSRFALRMLPGDHFFLRSSQHLLLKLLTREMHEIISSSSIHDQ